VNCKQRRIQGNEFKRHRTKLSSEAEAAWQDSPEPSGDNLPQLHLYCLYDQIPDGEGFLGSGKFLGFLKE